jgi:hypothetical protein
VTVADEQPPDPPKEWDLPVKWVILTAVAMWLVGAAALLFYLFGPRTQP